jgi:hypothetical protein
MLINILLTIMLVNTCNGSIDLNLNVAAGAKHKAEEQLQAPKKKISKITNVIPSQIERDLRYYQNLTTDNERIEYLKEFLITQKPPLQVQELQLLVPILYAFYRANKCDLLKQITISENWRSYLLEFQPALDRVFQAVDFENKNSAIKAAGIAPIQEESVLPLSWQDELDAYELALKVQEFYLKKYPNGLPDFEIFESEILKNAGKFGQFNCAIIYTLLMLGHAECEISQNWRKISLCLNFHLFSEEFYFIQKIMLDCGNSSKACKLLLQEAIGTCNQNKPFIVAAIIKDTALLNSLALIVESYAREYPWMLYK